MLLPSPKKSIPKINPLEGVVKFEKIRVYPPYLISEQVRYGSYSATVQLDIEKPVKVKEKYPGEGWGFD